MGNKFQEIHKLLEKREDIKRKLQKLEDMKNQTKPHIYEKVKKDYEGKLNEVVSSLNGYIDTLEESFKGLTPQLQELTKKESTIDDAIEELNVRYQLEEFSSEEYNAKKNEYEKQLSTIREKKAVIEKEIEEINSLLEAIKGEKVTPTLEKEEEGGKVIEESVIEEIPEFEEDEKSLETSEYFGETDSLIAESQLEDSGDDILSSDKILEEIESSDIQPDTELINSSDILGDLESELVEETTDNEKVESLENLETFENLDDLEGLEGIEENIEESLDSLVEDISGDLGLDNIGEEIPADSDIIHEEELKLDGETEVEGIKCPKCGFVNKPDAWFCEKCGADLQ